MDGATEISQLATAAEHRAAPVRRPSGKKTQLAPPDQLQREVEADGEMSRELLGEARQQPG